MLKEYINYIVEIIMKQRDSYWFKRKLYGWGWTPVTLQGWLLIVIFIGYMIWNSFALDANPEPTAGQITWFFVKTILSVVVLIVICYKKGEKPKWSWGPEKKKEEK